MKNVHHSFFRAQGDIFKLLILSNQWTKTETFPVYYHIWHRTAGEGNVSYFCLKNDWKAQSILQYVYNYYNCGFSRLFLLLNRLSVISESQIEFEFLWKCGCHNTCHTRREESPATISSLIMPAHTIDTRHLSRTGRLCPWVIQPWAHQAGPLRVTLILLVHKTFEKSVFKYLLAHSWHFSWWHLFNEGWVFRVPITEEHWQYH